MFRLARSLGAYIESRESLQDGSRFWVQFVRALQLRLSLWKLFLRPKEVGEGGVLLSVGQKQLISLARAVLARPELFIMDEATSSVDTLTEALIQRGMEALMKGRTSFVIAHRLSTIRRANRIIVIENGKISEQGTHAELLRLGGHYYRLYTQQFRHELEAQYGLAEAVGTEVKENEAEALAAD